MSKTENLITKVNSTTHYETTGKYLPGGRNVLAGKYKPSKGYPPFPDRASFIGTLKGSWFEMGKQFGERSGDSVRCVSDIWWQRQCDLWGKTETTKAMRLYQEQIRALDPGLIEFMEGIAEGASPWLSDSEYAEEGHPLYCTDYERVLGVNIQDEWTMRHPHFFPDGSSSFGGSEDSQLEMDIPTMCSGFSARGNTTRNGEVIAAQNRQCAYDPRCYEQVYVICPENGNAC